MSDQGGCSWVQDTSVTLCEENKMFWEVSGIGTEVIGFLKFAIFGIFHPLILSRVIYFGPFNDWGGGGRNKFVPVLGGNGMKTAPTGNIFDQLPGQMR